MSVTHPFLLKNHAKSIHSSECKLHDLPFSFVRSFVSLLSLVYFSLNLMMLYIKKIFSIFYHFYIGIEMFFGHSQTTIYIVISLSTAICLFVTSKSPGRCTWHKLPTSAITCWHFCPYYCKK